MCKITLITFTVFYLMQILSATKTAAPINNCTLQFRCTPYYEELIWTFDGSICRPIQNGCLLAQENCARVNRNQEDLQVIDEEVCADFCPKFCTKIYRPVKADFAYKTTDGGDDIETLTFANLCLLQAYSCSNARAYINVVDEWKRAKPRAVDVSKKNENCKRAQ